MLSIAHLIATNRGRGAEKFALALAESLSKFELKQNIVVIRSYGAARNRGGVPEVPMYFRRPPFPTLIWEALAFRYVLNQRKPDIVLCHGLRTAKVARIACLFMRRRPVLVMKKIGMTSDWVRTNKAMRNAFSRWVLRGLSLIIVLGPSQLRELTEVFGQPERKIACIPNGRPLRTASNIRHDPAKIVFVGSLEPEKGPDVALRVLKGVLARAPSASLHFLGEGSLRTQLEEEASALGIRDSVEFRGHVEDVSVELHSAAAMLISSRTEGVPGVAIEAAMAGLPVVSWDVGDVAAVVADGVSGVLVKRGDEDALSAALWEVISNDRWHQSHSRGARERSSMFDIDVISQAYMKIFNELSSVAATK